MRILIAAGLVSCSVLMAAAPAWAGFDFVPSSRPEAPASLDMPVAERPAPVESEAMAPLAAGDVVVVPDVPADQAPVVITPEQPNVSEPAPAAAAPITNKRPVYPPPGNRAAVPLRGSTDIAATSAPVRSVQTVKTADESEPTPPVAQAAPMVPTATDTSMPRLAVIEGFGNNIPLSLAMEQIIPADFAVTYQDQPDPDMNVSWSGGRAWNKALEDAIYAHGYRVMVAGKTVTIFKAGRGPGTSQPTLTPAESAPVATPEGVVVPAPAMAAPVAAAPSGYQPQNVAIFSGRAGENARDVLARWADQVGIQLVWEAGDQFVLADATAYNATFARATEQLLGQFRGQPARPIAELHPNAPTGPVVLNVKPASESTLVVRP